MMHKNIPQTIDIGGRMLYNYRIIVLLRGEFFNGQYARWV